MVERSRRVPSAGGSSAAAEAGTTTLLDLLHRLTRQLSTLFHQEVRLAVSEISSSLTGLFFSLASVATGGAVLYAGFLLLLLAAVFGIATIVPLWLASMAVGLSVAIIGCTLVLVGKHKLKASGLAPTHTATSLRRDKDVLTRNVS
jgi:uncharacterized membrane protein YqjE